ncbi:DUF6571 family protein [Streptosporangium saharense]|uniref:Uncharacterized protein n=1 Tax=Streptosporangium saharense TaxID=1706840 RepID=A0A7W7QP17_9ACTN|nr:DUF6571 family protein [Streptosporangium saharense]MBB4917155.1 hypothetical protein [Streptosporangium saharense]
MDDFEKGLGRAQDTLGRNEPRIRGALQKLDLDTSGLNALREVRSWIETSRPDLRRRSETIRAERTAWGTSSSLDTTPFGLPTFDEQLYGKAAHDPDVYAAVLKLNEAAEKGEIDQKALTELEKRTGNSEFALGLMTTLGATRFRELMTKAVEQGDGKNAKRLQAALGKTLGTASPKLSNAWRDELVSRPALGWPGNEYRGVAEALKHGTFASPFLLAVARKIDAWDREPSPPGITSNVMVPLMEALSRNPEAAQDFFAGDPTTMERFLVNWEMSDGGEALGKALEVAMLKFRDHDGSPQHPSRGYLSAKLASEFVHLRAKQLRSGDSIDSILKPATVGRILAGYINDINRVAQVGDDAPVPGAQDNDNPSTPGQDAWGAQFNLADLRRVMKDAFADPEAFTSVLTMQTAFADWVFDHGAAQMAAGKGNNALLAGVQRIGAGFAMITDAANLAGVEKGKEMDEKQQRNMKLLTATVNTALALPQSKGWPVIAGVVGAWTGVIEDSVKGNKEDLAREDAGSAVSKTRNLVHDLTARAMLKHGLFGSAEPASKTHPWASLKDLDKWENPVDNPDNFLKGDGRTLMGPEDMTDKDRQTRAYRRWLYGGLSGKPWQDVVVPLDQSFYNGFNQYGA